MNPLQKLLAARKAVNEKIEALVNADSMSDDQRAEHDRLVAEYDALTARIEQAKAAEARADQQAAEEEAAAAVARKREAEAERTKRVAAAARLTTPDEPTRGRQAGVVRTDDQGRPVSFLEETDERIDFRIGESPDAVRRKTYEQTKRQNARELKRAGYAPWNEFKSFNEFVRDGLENHSHADFRDRHAKHFATVQGMSEGVGSDGGYTVMPEFSTGILDRVYANDLWSRTDNYSVTGNNMTFLANAETSRATGSRAGGLQGYWMGEGGSITSSKPTLREVSLKLMKGGVVVYLTNELISDGGFALQEYVTRKVAEEFNFMLGDALVNGSGVGKPLGVLNAPPLVSVAKETGQTAATLQTENITKMFARFYAPNFGRSIWLHNQDILPQLLTMTLGIGAAGVTTYMPPGGLSGGPYGTLLGRPLLPTEFNATLGTQGDLILADLSQMLSISKGGVAQAVSMHVQFLTDQLALRFTIRVNATPWESAPITPFKGTATQANFVTLDTRS